MFKKSEEYFKNQLQQHSFVIGYALNKNNKKVNYYATIRYQRITSSFNGR